VSALLPAVPSTASTLSARTPTTQSRLVLTFQFYVCRVGHLDLTFLQLTGTSTSLSGTTLDINGSLTVSGAALQLQLDNASVAVSGDLRIQDGIKWFHCAPSSCVTALFSSAVLSVSLSSSWSLTSSPIVVAGSFLLDPTSILAFSLPPNAYSGVAPIATGRSSSLQG